MSSLVTFGATAKIPSISLSFATLPSIERVARANGRSHTTASWAFFIFTVEMSSIALVIFPVFFTDLIRDFISFQEGMKFF
jgi:hypothetical protein